MFLPFPYPLYTVTTVKAQLSPKSNQPNFPNIPVIYFKVFGAINYQKSNVERVQTFIALLTMHHLKYGGLIYKWEKKVEYNLTKLLIKR